MKKSYSIIIVALVVIVAIGIVFNKKQTNDDSITLGFIGPLSGFGAPWGEEQKFAIDTAAEEINQSGGIKGKKIKIIYEDGKCGAKEATTAAQKLISVDKVKIIFTVCGQESLTVAPIAEKNKVIMMALWSTHPDLSGIGQYIFRNSYSDEDTGKIMADTVNASHNKVAIISEIDGFATGLRDIFKKYYRGEIIEKNYQPGTKDFRTVLVDLIAQKPKSIVINPADASDGLLILRQLRQLGFNGQVYGNYFGGINSVLSAPEAQGMIFFTDPYVKDNLLKEKLYSEFQVTYKRKPNFDFAVSVSFDSVYIIRQAVEAEGMDTDKLKNYLHNLKDFNGIMGTYGFNDKGDAVGYTPTIYKIDNGKMIQYLK